MSQDQNDWKRKYKEVAIELEKLEKSQNSELLRLALSHLTLGLQGRSAELDEELAQLRTALSGSSQLDIPKKLVTGVEKQIRKLDETREQTTKQLISALEDWVRQVKKHLAISSSARDDLAELERDLSNSVEKLYELPRFIAQMIYLQESIFVSKNLTPIDGKTTEPPQLDLTGISAELIQLIGVLNLTRDGRLHAIDLIRRLEQGIQVSELIDIVMKVVELAQLAASTSNEDFESYLINLNAQLLEVQSFLQDNHTEQNVAGNAHRELDQKVRNDVSSIHKAVKESVDLTELKSSVSEQLSGIVRAMDEFKRSEEARDERLQKRYDALIKHVEDMEEETKRVKAHMEEERLKARTDSLTGLPNRAAYDEHLRKEFERWSRYQQGFSVVVGDLDLFKRINDNYGHLAGDKVLRLVARVLSRNMRSADFIARFGGEEFVILMPSTSAEEGSKAIEKLRVAISKSPFNFHGKPVTITMSFGIAETQEGDTAESVFERADGALYKAKQTGRNRVCIG